MSRTKPTICQVLHTLNVGGAEVLAARLARGLDHSFRFVFVCLDELGTLGEELRRDDFSVSVLGRKPGLDWKFAYRMGSLWGKERIDLVHAHQYTPFFYSLMARWFYRPPPILFTEHGRHFPDYPRRKRIVANRLLLQRRDRVLGVGEAVRQALIANEGIPGKRVGVIYNGVDLSPFSRNGENRSLIRQELGLGQGDFGILQVARLDYLKDHLTAIRALGQVVTTCKNARLVLVGEGPEEKTIKEEVARLDLGPYVRFLGLRKDVPRLLPAADLFLLTSISEGIPLTVIEAMGAGLPVVSTRVGGLAEVAEDYRTGFLVPAGDHASLAEKIVRLANDPELRIKMGQLGKQRALTLFSESKMHGEYERLYQEMLHGSLAKSGKPRPVGLCG